MIEVSKKSWIIKMIEKSLWWFGEDYRFEAPATTCGLFFGGVLSGLWHVAYIVVMLCMGLGALVAIAFLIDVDLLSAINFELLPSVIKVLIFLGIYAATVSAAVIILTSVIEVIKFINKFCTGNGKISYLLGKVNGQVQKVLHGSGKVLGIFCKPIKYK